MVPDIGWNTVYHDGHPALLIRGDVEAYDTIRVTNAKHVNGGQYAAGDEILCDTCGEPLSLVSRSGDISAVRYRGFVGAI